MKKIIQSALKKMFGIVLTISFIFLPYGVSHAEDSTRGTIGNTGRQTTAEIQETTGPIEPTGRIEQEPTIPAIDTVPINQNATEVNSDTGPNSENNNEINQNNDTNIATDNNAAVNNDADLTLNSGQNQIGNNSVVGSIETGEIDAGLTFVNVSNSQFAEGSQISTSTLNGSGLEILDLSNDGIPSTSIDLPCVLQGQNVLSNDTTGYNSLNTNTTNQNSVIGIIDNNDADTNNNLVIDANSGLNNIDQNTKVGDIVTGDINLATNLINLQNFVNPNMIVSLGIVNILDDLNADIIVPKLANNTSGSSSSNYNNVDSANQINIENNNNADANTLFNATTNTGENNIGANTVTGDITTGDTSIDSNIIDWLNSDSGTLHIINVFGEWVGDAIGLIDSGNFIINQMGADPMAFLGGGSNAPPIGFDLPGDNGADLTNSTTGTDSTNTNEIDSSNTVDILENNNSNANNNIKINANTGRNKINDNTVIGNINTGDINLYSNVVNIMNNFSNRAGKVTLKIINIFGNWRGNLSNKHQEQDPPPVVPNTTENPPSVEIEHRTEIKADEASATIATKNKITVAKSLALSSSETTQIPEDSDSGTITGIHAPLDNPVNPKISLAFLIIPALLLIAWAGFEWYARSRSTTA